jgi:nucleoside-diphosphate-sugar epimerase
MITGGAGYVGCCLVPHLLEHGHQVGVIDKLVFGDDGLSDYLEQIELRVKDIRKTSASDYAGYDAVVHLAGLSNDPTAEFSPEANVSINRDGAEHVARMARDAGVKRFVFASSCSIYYTLTPDDVERTEEYPVDPQAPYSKAKREAEIALLELASEDFSPVCLRKGTVYGQSGRMRYDLVLNTFTKDAFDRRTLTVHCGGRMWRPILSLQDAVRAYRLALEAPREKIHGQIVNILSDNSPVIKLARDVRRVVEGSYGAKLDLNIQEVGTTRSYRVAGWKAVDVLGFEPKSNIGDEVQAMWDSLERGVDYAQPHYYNIRWLELLRDMRNRLVTMGGDAL